jgi:serine protease
VAGTIAAQGGNDEGVVGVIPSSQGICLLIARIFDDVDNSGQADSVIYQGIEWCAENGARVFNLSFGGLGYDRAGDELMAALVQRGMLVVAAAGNDGLGFYQYPASFPDVISVAAVDDFFYPWGYSQYNDEVDLAAPGVGIESTFPGNAYYTLDGTSMATAHVTAAIAKIWAARPQCTNYQVREAVELSALDVAYPGLDEDTGNGVVQVAAAYQVKLAWRWIAFCALQFQETHTFR